MENVISNFKEKFHKIEMLTKEGKSVEEINEMFSQKPLLAAIFDWFLIVFIVLFVGSILIELNNQYLKRTNLFEIIKDSYTEDSNDNENSGSGKKKKTSKKAPANNSGDKKHTKFK